MKLNLGGGNKRFEGFINVDLYGDVEIHHDLNKAPYPFKDNSIDEIISEHCLEHLDKPDLFWKEVHRILKPKGKATVVVPHCWAATAYSSFGHRHYFHENAIKEITYKGEFTDVSVQRGFKLIETKVLRGRFMKWQKRAITWVVEKI